MGFLGIGFDPKWSVEQVPVMPKGRYKLMKSYMPTVGSMGLDMMFRSCTVQVNLDYSSEPDMVEKFRIGLALQVRHASIQALHLYITRSFVRGHKLKMWCTCVTACSHCPFCE